MVLAESLTCRFSSAVLGCVVFPGVSFITYLECPSDQLHWLLEVRESMFSVAFTQTCLEQQFASFYCYLINLPLNDATINCLFLLIMESSQNLNRFQMTAIKVQWVGFSGQTQRVAGSVIEQAKVEDFLRPLRGNQNAVTTMKDCSLWKSMQGGDWEEHTPR